MKNEGDPQGHSFCHSVGLAPALTPPLGMKHAHTQPPTHTQTELMFSGLVGCDFCFLCLSSFMIQMNDAHSALCLLSLNPPAPRAILSMSECRCKSHNSIEMSQAAVAAAVKFQSVTHGSCQFKILPPQLSN